MAIEKGTRVTINGHPGLTGTVRLLGLGKDQTLAAVKVQQAHGRNARGVIIQVPATALKEAS